MRRSFLTVVIFAFLAWLAALSPNALMAPHIFCFSLLSRPWVEQFCYVRALRFTDFLNFDNEWTYKNYLVSIYQFQISICLTNTYRSLSLSLSPESRTNWIANTTTSRAFGGVQICVFGIFLLRWLSNLNFAFECCWMFGWVGMSSWPLFYYDDTGTQRHGDIVHGHKINLGIKNTRPPTM